MKSLITTLLVTGLLATNAHAHSGGTNSAGCHAGSQPYHCHNSSPSFSGGSDVGKVIAGVAILGIMAGIANEIDKANKKKHTKKKIVVNQNVLQVQLFLNNVNNAGLVVDGQYGQKTKQAIYNYYALFPNLDFDGKFDKYDLQVMKFAYNTRQSQTNTVTTTTTTSELVLSNVQKLRLCLTAKEGNAQSKQLIQQYNVNCN